MCLKNHPYSVPFISGKQKKIGFKVDFFCKTVVKAKRCDYHICSFNEFLQSLFDGRREGDEVPLSGVVAESMMLSGNSFYRYQIKDRSTHTITKYMNDEKSHKAFNELSIRIEYGFERFLSGGVEKFCISSKFKEVYMDTDSLY